MVREERPQNRNGRISYGGGVRTTFRTRKNIEDTANRLARQAESQGNNRRANQIRKIASRWTSSTPTYYNYRDEDGRKWNFPTGGAPLSNGLHHTSSYTQMERNRRADKAAKGASNG